jgi:S1-C subfamily serine protease
VNVAQELSDALAQAASAAATRVVRIEAREGAPASGVVWSPDGLIVTASHSVEDDEGIEVALPDGTTLEATLRGRDADIDIAVLEVKATGLAAAEWVEPDELKIGSIVLAVSRPGRTARASWGSLFALGGEWRTSAGGRVDRWLESDVALHPGFSGSLLVDVQGRAIGLNTSGLARGHATALPTPTVRRVVTAILAHGRVRRGYLGVATMPVRLAAALETELGQPTGLLVSSVEAGTPAEKAGFLIGDVIVGLDGQRVTAVGELLALLDEERIGREVRAKLVRAGKVEEKSVSVGARGG